jgi:phage terminase small subunit
MPTTGKFSESHPVTAKMEAFVREYVVDFNGGAAALRAGYKGKQAAMVNASKLLGDARIQRMIQAEKEKLVERTGITKAWLVEKLKASFIEAAEAKSFAGTARLGELLAKMHGMIIERRDIRQVTSWDDLSDHELEALVRQETRH